MSADPSLPIFIFQQLQRLIVDPTVPVLTAMRRFANNTDDPPMTALMIAAISLNQHAELIRKGTPNKPTAVQYCQEFIDGLIKQQEESKQNDQSKES